MAINEADRFSRDEHAVPQPVCHVFELQSEQTSNAVALICGEVQWSYAQLNAKANRVAHQLNRIGIVPSERVGIALPRSPEIIAAILGVWKAGGSVLPLDVTHPRDRLVFIRDEACVQTVLTQGDVPLVADIFQNVIQPNVDNGPNHKGHFQRGIRPESEAMVVYTSGSSGRPRGVRLSHANLSRLANRSAATLGHQPDDVYLMSSSITFVVAIRQIVTPLFLGAPLVLASETETLDPIALFETIKLRGVTRMDLVPSYWRMCIHAFSSLPEKTRRNLLDNRLRLIVPGGEPLQSELPRLWQQSLGHSADIIHVFGQTETTGFVTAFPIDDASTLHEPIVPVGKPAAQTHCSICDEDGRPVSDGATGELYVAGPCVGMGYINRPKLTARTFASDPSQDVPDTHLCRTGDLARRDENGLLHIVGRRDRQVKLHGIRVEPAEVEVVLREYPGIADVAVVAPITPTDERALVAYYTPSDGEKPGPADLRAYVSERLPAFLVPSVFVLLESPPLNRHGKLDRHALASRPFREAHENLFYVPEWNRTSPVTLPPEILQPETVWLLITDEPESERIFRAKLTNVGQTVIVVSSGEGFACTEENTFTVNPSRPDDFDSLFVHLRHASLVPRYVIYHWTFEDPAQAVRSVVPSHLLGLFHLFGSIRLVCPEANMQLSIVSRCAQEVIGSELLIPENATVIGLCIVASVENTRLRCRSIDIEGPICTELAAQIIADTAGDRPGLRVAYRNNDRWVQTIAPFQASGAASYHVRPGGVYLITGGLGGIGRAIALTLARSAPVKLVLTGRTPFPPKSEWADRQRRLDDQDPNAPRINDLRAMEDLGAEVLVLRADVTDKERMTEVVDMVGERFGPIRGVVHAACVLSGFETMGAQKAESAKIVLPSKTVGTRVLASVLKGKDLDFVMLCSSLSSVIGRYGQADYCAGNAFLDAVVRSMRRAGLPAVSVNWDTWQNTRISTDDNTSEALVALIREDQRRGLPQSIALKAFLKLAEAPAAQVVVTQRALCQRVASLDVMRSRFVVSSGKSLTGTTETKNRLAEIWKAVLQRDDIDIHDNFFELGGHSLHAVEMGVRVEAVFGQHLSLEQLFRAPTIAGVAAILAGEIHRNPWSHLVEMQGHGSNFPLFCVHNIGGSAVIYGAFARRMMPDVPVYGLQGQGLDGRSITFGSVQEMAKAYVAEIRQIQPRGPYHFLSFCLGSRVVLEMAQLLIADGERIGLLAFVDGLGPAMPRSLSASLREEYLQNIPHFRRSVTKKFVDRIEENVQIRLRRLRRRIGNLIAISFLHFGLRIPDRFKFEYIITMNRRIMHAYRPAPYPGVITLFRSSRTSMLPQDLGWGSISTGGINTHDIVGPHRLLVEPYVEELASVIKDEICRSPSNPHEILAK